MGQQVSIIELKEQIEAAKRGLAKMSPVINAADPSFQPVAMPAALDQDMVADDDIASCKDFQFFHRPKPLERPFSLSSPVSKANADVSACDDDQLLFQAFDQRLDRIENDIAQTRKHTLELITLLSGIDMVAKPIRQNSPSVNYLLRRNLYWFVIGFLVISWAALTPSGHYWINYFMGLI